MKKEKQEVKDKFPKWLKIENTLNDHRQPTIILCRTEVDFNQTKDRYNSSNYLVTEFNYDPRNASLKQRKSFR